MRVYYYIGCQDLYSVLLMSHLYKISLYMGLTVVNKLFIKCVDRLGERVVDSASWPFLKFDIAT